MRSRDNGPATKYSTGATVLSRPAHRAHTTPDRDRTGSLSTRRHLAWTLFHILALIVVTVVVCPGVASATVHRPNLEERSNYGLGPNVVVPKWAIHTRTHFTPVIPNTGLNGFPAASTFAGEAGYAEGECLGMPCREPPLLYKEGEVVQHNPHVYLIFWGSDWNQEPGLAQRAQLEAMYKGLTGSAYQGILTQYFDSTGRISATVAVSSYTDVESVGTAPVLVNGYKIQDEMVQAIKANPAWTLEADSQFVVLPAPGSTYEPEFTGYCAYHSAVTYESHAITYSFVPYVGDSPFESRCIGYGNGNIDNATSALAVHEYAESATDPFLSTWKAHGGGEIGDLCTGSRSYISGGAWVQALYDDHQDSCSFEDLNPPHVYAVTGGAASMSSQEVGVRATVNAEGLETKYYFEYGTTSSYGSRTSEESIGSGVSNIKVERSIGGVAVGAAYHYRIVVTNSTGTTYGEDRLFRGTSSTWAVAQAGEGELQHVSCVSATSCVAIGENESKPLAETWNGDEWKSVATPTGAKVLRRISCTSTAFCIVVGQSTGNAFAVQWNGTEWSAMTLPNPEGSVGGNELYGVSCVSSSLCVAVGRYTTKLATRESPGSETAPFTELWNGSKWAVITAPKPSGWTESELQGVSCSSAASCIAVGNGGKRLSESVLAESWNGSTWSLVAVANPSGAAWAELDSVSCPSSSSCEATGSYYGGAATAFAEGWNGSSWTLQTVGAAGSLADVACPSVSQCTAVGERQNESTTYLSAERWNGKEWVGEPPVNHQGSKYQSLSGVSCPTVKTCTAVGGYEDSALAEYWRPALSVKASSSPGAVPLDELDGVSCVSAELCMGVGASSGGMDGPSTLIDEYQAARGAWVGLTAPNLGESNELHGVSCPSLSVCVTVGSSSSKSVRSVTAERWNGSSWTGETPPGPAEATSATLSSVSCPSTTTCFAVGSYLKNGTSGSIGEYWNGSTWTLQTMPAGKQELRGVSCVSSTFCVAVGTEGSTVPVAERWNGNEWTLMTLPAGGQALDGVSCSSSLFCVAVGKTGENTFAEQWNGSEWSVMTVPNPSGSAGSNELSGVSCVAQRWCVAVGGYVVKYVTHEAPEETAPLGEYWNGSEWAILSTLKPAGWERATLTSISCTSTTSCGTTGTGGKTLNELALAENWNGTQWSVKASGSPAAVPRDELGGVACSSAELCMGVGATSGGTDGPSTLIDEYQAARGSWVGLTAPNLGEANELHSVSCPSSSVCMTVGSSSTKTVRVVTAERWNGSSWTGETPPGPAEATSATLSGVSCPSTTACFAVGSYLKNATGASIGDYWNGSTWTSQSMPAGKQELRSVSCPSSTFCVAVGTEGSTVPVAERWNGTEWTLMTLPAAGQILNGVSCSSSSFCIAVGKAGENVFAEQWNGSEWTITSIPNPSGSAGGNELTGVSCVAPTACMTVGGYVVKYVTHETPEETAPLSEYWNGSEWATLTTPKPTGWERATLTSVSCTSAITCDTTGTGGKTSNELTLAENYG